MLNEEEKETRTMIFLCKKDFSVVERKFEFRQNVEIRSSSRCIPMSLS